MNKMVPRHLTPLGPPDALHGGGAERRGAHVGLGCQWPELILRLLWGGRDPPAVWEIRQLVENPRQPLPVWRGGWRMGSQASRYRSGWEIYNSFNGKACGTRAINLPAFGWEPTLSHVSDVAIRPPTQGHTSMVCYHHNASLCLFQQTAKSAAKPTHPPCMCTYAHVKATHFFGSWRKWSRLRFDEGLLPCKQHRSQPIRR